MKKMTQIIPAEKVELSAGKISKLQCDDVKKRIYLWDSEVKGFGVLATNTGSKSFIFQTKLHGKSVRLTIGKVSVWKIPEARAEARRLQVLIDKGIDPRQQAAEQRVKTEAAQALAKSKEALVRDAWEAYLLYQKDKMQHSHIERGKRWGERHLRDHENLSQAGGEPKKRGEGVTTPGVLYPLLFLRLADINAKKHGRPQSLGAHY